jgi:hypothetical protein
VKGFAATKLFSEAALWDQARAAALVDQFPETDLEGEALRCHEVVRAVRDRLHTPDQWELTDGFYKTVNHTWLINRDGHILDVYSVARYPVVQLFDTDVHFHRDIFRPKKPRDDIREHVVEYLRGLIKGL